MTNPNDPVSRLSTLLSGPRPDVDYNDLTNLACCLDVVTTILAGSDRPDCAGLFTALVEGAKYNNTELDDLSADIEPESAIKNLNHTQMSDDLIACGAALISQLELELAEQRTAHGQRI